MFEYLEFWFPSEQDNLNIVNGDCCWTVPHDDILVWKLSGILKWKWPRHNLCNNLTAFADLILFLPHDVEIQTVSPILKFQWKPSYTISLFDASYFTFLLVHSNFAKKLIGRKICLFSLVQKRVVEKLFVFCGTKKCGKNTAISKAQVNSSPPFLRKGR